MSMQRVSLVLLAAFTMLETQAIIIRHDVAPSRYEVRAAEYPAVFYLEQQGNRRVCAATVIHRQWAITAAHCASETTLANTIENGRRFGVRVAGQERTIDRLIIHPDYDQESSSDVDLALLRFTQASATPLAVPLQLAATELDQVVNIMGWGFFGLGTSGRQYDNGTFRRAENRISSAQRRLRIFFDDPRVRGSDSLALEGMPSLGDSGGPAIITSANGPRLAGILVGEIEGVDFSEETQGKYGSVAVYERISKHIDWIETVVGSAVPFES